MYLLPINGVIGEDFKMTDLLLHLNAAKEESAIKLIINSPGGYVDVSAKMREAIEKSGKLILSTNSGDVASAAVELFLTAEFTNRTFDPAKGVFLIHMPFIDERDGGASGTSEELRNIADEMRSLEKSHSSFYSKRTGTSANILEGFMKENQPLSPEEVSNLGFASIVQAQTLKAVAYFNKNDDMKSEEVEKKLGTIEGLLQKVMGFIKPKALMLQDANGASIDFGAELEDPTQVAVGVTATVDGSPAQGEYPMADGSVLVFDAGTLAEIVPPVSENIDALKQENEQLKADLEAKNSEFLAFKESAEEQINAVSTEFKAFRAQYSKGEESDIANLDRSPEQNKDKPAVRKAFKSK